MLIFSDLMYPPSSVQRKGPLQFGSVYHGKPAGVCSADDERKIASHRAGAFGLALKQAYRKLGYDLIVFPKANASERAGFICSKAASFS